MGLPRDAPDEDRDVQLIRATTEAQAAIRGLESLSFGDAARRDAAPAPAPFEASEFRGFSDARHAPDRYVFGGAQARRALAAIGAGDSDGGAD